MKLGPRKRGRKPKWRGEQAAIAHCVFLIRYGVNAVPGYGEPDFDRKPGTVHGYRSGGGPVPKPDCSINEACRRLEFQLKSPRRRQAVHPVTGERQEWEIPPVIGKRRSDGVTASGKATRRALDRFLGWERGTLSGKASRHAIERAEWNRKLEALHRRKAGRPI